ncbi:hypothetical protein EIP86_007252 [Pleurotus ostreatoroseus]|nr:hypothetical protein EIP86_007252 [Pleurotus ostreatoroseus]
MKVLVMGTTGAIGFPVAQGLVRAGHTVYGMTRSAAKTNQLLAEEITPIIGSPKDLSPIVPLIPTLDVLIDITSGPDLHTLSVATLATLTSLVQAHRPLQAPKLTYIYTSGIWVHGNSRTEPVSDTTPLATPASLVAWRPAHEQAVLTSTDLIGVVIRPALVYGRGASLFAPLFKGASDGAVRWFGGPDLYVLVAERAPLVRGLAFDAANDFTENVDEFLKKLVHVSGAESPHEYIPSDNVFEEAWTTTMLLRPYLARSLFGWRPKKMGLIEGLVTYYNAWKASESL